MKKILFALLFFWVSIANAACPLGQAYEKAKNAGGAWFAYKGCADNFKDAESQVYIAMQYLNGSDFAQQNLATAFQYFRAAAEDGYAPAQRELAKLMVALEDIGPEGKAALADFEKDWQTKSNSTRPPMSALAWMILAAEKAENKWFYMAPAIADAEALNLLSQYRSKMDSKVAESQAVAFKQEQLMQQARNLLTDAAYKDFESIIYPEKYKGKIKMKMSRTKAIEELKKLKMSIEK